MNLSASDPRTGPVEVLITYPADGSSVPAAGLVITGKFSPITATLADLTVTSDYTAGGTLTTSYDPAGDGNGYKGWKATYANGVDPGQLISVDARLVVGSDRSAARSRFTTT